jgi:hypothetical protein
MVVFILPKWVKFSHFTGHRELYHELLAGAPLFTRQSLDDPTKQEVVAHAPWPIKLWLVDANCDFYDSVPTNILAVHVHAKPPSVHVPPSVPT